MKMVHRLSLLPVLTVLLAACAPTEPLTRDDPSVATAEFHLAAGDFEAAARTWLELARQHPGQAAGFRLSAAEARLGGGDLEGARSLIAQLTAEELEPYDGTRLRLLRAELALLEGELTTAERFLAIDPEHLPEALVERHGALLDRLEQRRRVPVEAAAGELLTAMAEGRFTPELALASLIGIPLADLQSLQRAHAGDPRLDPWLELALAARRHLLDPERLTPALAEWQQTWPEVGYSAAEADEWLAAFRDTADRPARVAVLLPGSGALERPGKALREGMLARWLELDTELRPALRFYYLDEAPDAAVSAWFQAREDGADFLIGPLDRRHIDALIALPDPGVPLLLLNQPEHARTPAPPTTPTAVLALPPEEEAELAAVHALIRGHRRALVLAQNSTWGGRVADRFIETFTLGGGRISGRAEYAVEEADHSDLLATLLQLDHSEARIRALGQALGAELASQPQSRTDIDLVFLAARSDDARQLRPQLRFFGAGGVPVYATSHVFDGSGDGADLEGIELPAAPWLIDSTTAGRQRQLAEQRFEGLGNPTMSRLHALGRDAISLVPWLGWMQADPDLYLAGATGRLRLADGRVLERDLPWARIAPGRLVTE